MQTKKRLNDDSLHKLDLVQMSHGEIKNKQFYDVMDCFQRNPVYSILSQS